MAWIVEDAPGRAGVQIFICGTNPGKCHYCSRRATALCEQTALPKNEIEPRPQPTQFVPETCGRRICGQCARHPAPGRNVCRIHQFPVAVP